jgi:hypothetical protein
MAPVSVQDWARTVSADTRSGLSTQSVSIRPGTDHAARSGARCSWPCADRPAPCPTRRRYGCSLNDQNGGSARVLPGQPPSLTVTDLSGRPGDAVERLVERPQAAFVCIACVPGRFLRRSCRLSVRCAAAVLSSSAGSGSLAGANFLPYSLTSSKREKPGPGPAIAAGVLRRRRSDPLPRRAH